MNKQQNIFLFFQDESEEEYSSEDASDEEYEEELGSDESSGKDWSDLEREAAEDDADLLNDEDRGGGRRSSKHKEKVRTKHRFSILTSSLLISTEFQLNMVYNIIFETDDISAYCRRRPYCILLYVTVIM